jgi:hypothetical protein
MADKNDKDTGGFKGIKQEDLDVLKKAAGAWTQLTGESVKAVDQIPVLPEESGDPKELATKAGKELEATAEVTKQKEDADQAARRAAAGLDENGHPQEGGQPPPVLAPEAARQLDQAKANRPKSEPAKKDATAKAAPAAPSAPSATNVKVSS